jgi:hypothetical protein
MGVVLAKTRVDAIHSQLMGAYDIRNALFHRDDDSGITHDLIDAIEACVFQMLDFEVAKAKRTP